MEDLQLEIFRLRRENATLRHRLTTTNQFMALHVQINVGLERQVAAVNGHFERSLVLLESLINDRSESNKLDAYSKVYHLLNPN